MANEMPHISVPNGNDVNVIAAGTVLTGDITAKSDCRIDGSIKGNIKCESKVIIGQTGMLEGDVECHSIEIRGKVKANVTAKDLIALSATAILAGNIVSSKLSIELPEKRHPHHPQRRRLLQPRERQNRGDSEQEPFCLDDAQLREGGD